MNVLNSTVLYTKMLGLYVLCYVCHHNKKTSGKIVKFKNPLPVYLTIEDIQWLNTRPPKLLLL